MKTEVKLLKLSQEGFIQCYKWVDESINNKGVVLIVHGMAEHVERYEELSKSLTKNGYVVYGHNQRGHKDSVASYEDYGYASDENNFNILVTDIREITNIIKDEYPDLPLFIIGHSMGSFITQRYVQLHGNQISGIILSGSAKQPNNALTLGINLAKMITKVKGRRHRSKLLNKLSFESYNKKFRPNRTKFDWLNRDEKEVDKYIDDKWCGGIFTAAFFKDFFIGLKTINQNYELVRKDLPIFFISGSKDPVGGSSRYITKLYKTYRRKEIADLELKLYKNTRHEIFLELNKDEVINDCINWLNKHVN